MGQNQQASKQHFSYNYIGASPLSSSKPNWFEMNVAVFVFVALGVALGDFAPCLGGGGNDVGETLISQWVTQPITLALAEELFLSKSSNTFCLR